MRCPGPLKTVILTALAVTAAAPSLLNCQMVTYTDTLTLGPAPSSDTLSHSPVMQLLPTVVGLLADTAMFKVDLIEGSVQRLRGADTLYLPVTYTVLTGLRAVYGPAWKFLPTLDEVHEGPAPVAPQATASARKGGELVTAGTLFRGLSVTAGQGAVLTGGLDLRLQGALSKDVFVNATLTDRNLPIQPEGNTQTLDELDQVRMAITAPWGRVTAGDFILEGKGGPLSRFRRKLEGLEVQLGGKGRPWHVGAAVAGSKGRYRSQTIAGEDGQQGPYLLATAEGSRSLVILAGTEVVWLNGVRLERGDGLDYTMDYSTGELFFTPRHPIRSDSRIVVDFEYSDLVYSRTTGYLTTGWKGAKSSLVISALSESDNPASSLAFSLSAEDRQRLRQAGDSDSSLTVSGAVADTAGDYDLVDGHYQWRGARQGDYKVAFFHVGTGGSYRRLVAGNRLVYEWTAIEDRASLGAFYAPYRTLTAPQRQDVITTAWERRGGSPGNRIQVEAALSRHDLNRLSATGDGDNLSGGYSTALQWTSNLPRDWQAGVDLKAQGRGVGFRPLGRWDAVELVRDWDLGGEPDRYQWQTLAGHLNQPGRHKFYAEVGRIQTDSVASGRFHWGAGKLGDKGLTGGWEQSLTVRDNRPGNWTINRADIKYNFKSIAPFLNIYTEDRDQPDGGGFKIDQWETGVAVKVRKSTLQISREERDERFTDGRWMASERWRLGFNRDVPGGSRLAANLSYNRQTFTPDGGDLNYILGDIAYRYRPRKGVWWVDFRHRLERTVAETRAVLYDSVGVGLGRYRYDALYDTYVADETGPYIRRFVNVGRTEPVVSLSSRLGSRIQLHQLRWMPKSVRRLSALQMSFQGKVESLSHETALMVIKAPNLSDAEAVSFRSTGQFELSFKRDKMGPRYVARAVRTTRLNRLQIAGITGGGLQGEWQDQTRTTLSRSQRSEIAGRQVSSDSKVSLGRRRLSSAQNPLRDYDIADTGLEATLATTVAGRLPVLGKLTASVTGRWGRELNRTLNDLEVRFLLGGIGLERPVGRGGRLRVDWELIQVRQDSADPIPLSMADGFPVGKSSRFRLTGQMPLAGSIMVTVSLFSRRAAGRDPVTTANLELRSQF